MKEHVINFGGFNKPTIEEIMFYVDETMFDKFQIKIVNTATFLGFYPETKIEFDSKEQLIEFASKNSNLKVKKMYQEYIQDNSILVMEVAY